LLHFNEVDVLSNQIQDWSTLNQRVTCKDCTFRNTGRVAGSLSFNGTVINIEDTPTLRPYKTFTIAAWLHISSFSPSIGATFNILCREPIVENTTSWCFKVTNMYLEFQLVSPTLTVNIQSPMPLRNATWTHVAVSFDGVQEVNLFVDGNLVSNYTLPFYWNTTYVLNYTGDANITVGNVTNQAACLIDELVMWSSSLSAWHISRLFDSVHIPFSVTFARPGYGLGVFSWAISSIDGLNTTVFSSQNITFTVTLPPPMPTLVLASASMTSAQAYFTSTDPNAVKIALAVILPIAFVVSATIVAIFLLKKKPWKRN